MMSYDRSGTTTALVLAVAVLVSCSSRALDSDAIPAPKQKIELVEELRLGVSEDVFFKRLGSVSVSESGEIFVTDWGEVTVYAFAPDGSYRGRLGGRGAGPGEYQLALASSARGDSVLVYTTSGVSVFHSPSLVHRRDYRWPDNVRSGRGMPTSTSQSSLFLRYAGAETGRQSIVGSVGIQGRDLVVRELFGVEDQFEIESVRPLRIGGQAATVDYSKPSWCVVGPSQFYCANTGKLSFLELSLDGKELSWIHVAHTPTPFDRDDRRHYVDRFSGTVFEDILEFPTTWRAFNELAIEGDDILWVTLFTDRDATQTTLWRVDLRQRTTQEGHVDGEFELEAVMGNRLYGIVTDSVGVNTVVVLKRLT